MANPNAAIARLEQKNALIGTAPGTASAAAAAAAAVASRPSAVGPRDDAGLLPVMLENGLERIGAL
jgi:hypothetical protein